MAGEALTPTTYIQHHLQNLTTPVGDGGGFWTLHVDTFLTAVVMGLIMVIGIVAKNGILLLDADGQPTQVPVFPHSAD